MKYIKLFEEIHPLLYDIHHDKPNLRLLIGKWLDKIKPINYSVDFSFYEKGNNPTLALRGSMNNRRSTYPVFTIGVTDVKDKKQRDNPNTIKQKLRLDCYNYHNTDVGDKDFIDALKEFIIDIFKKYSYFYKKKDTYWNKNMETYDYYILTEDIPKIMKDLETDFQYYIDAKKYNL